MSTILYVQRSMPSELIAPKLSRLPAADALNEVRALLTQCFWPLDVRYEKVIRTIDHLRCFEGSHAAIQFLRLDTECQFFVRFALEIYGLRLATMQIEVKESIFGCSKPVR